MKRRVGTIWASVLVLLLASCGSAATPTSAPTRVAERTATPVLSSAPTVTPVPVATPTRTPAVGPTPVGPKSGGTLRHLMWSDVASWDPYGDYTSHTHRHLNLMYGRLMTYRYGDPLCQLFPLEPDLAESWKWLNDITLEVKLRQGIRFQSQPPVNGRELVAEDVVYSFEDLYARQPFVKPAADLTESITALDKYTIRFKLKDPMVEYLEIGPGVQQAEILAPEVNTPKKTWRWEDHVGTGNGPFVLKNYLRGVRIDLEKNPNYFRPGLPYLAGVSLLIVPDEATVAAMMRSGKLDSAETRNPTVIDAMRTTAPQLNIQSCGYMASYVISMRTDKPPLNDVRVRRALSMAIDREAFNKTIWLGQGLERWSPLFASFGDWALKRQDYPTEVRQYLEYHPDKARTLLAEAGYPTGPQLRLSYGRHHGVAAVAVAETLSAFWRQIGVLTELDPQERTVYLATSRDYEQMRVTYASSVTVDEALYSYFRTGVPRNWSWVVDPELDKLLDAQRLAFDEAQRRKLVRDIQVRLVDMQYRLDLPQAPSAWVLQPYVKNVWYKTNAYSDSEWLRFTWLDR